MATSHDERHELYKGLEEVLGLKRATTLMESLVPAGWEGVAMKSDVDNLAAATKRDLERHAAATKRDLEQHAAATKRDLEQHAAATKRDLEQLRADTKRDLEQLRAELRGDFERALREQARSFFLAVLAANTALAGFMTAALIAAITVFR